MYNAMYISVRREENMARMIRKQVYLDERHDRMLKRRATARGITEADIIREALDCTAVGAGGVSRRSMNLDVPAGEKALAFMRSLGRRRSKGPAGRTWTRTGLYEGRIGRWAKS